MGALCLSLFWYALFCALPSFPIILKRKRELVAFLLLSYGYLVAVNVQWLFLMMQLVGLEFCDCCISLSYSLTSWSCDQDAAMLK